MPGYLGGNEETVNTLNASYGKVIKKVEMIDDELLFDFEDGKKIKLFDDGQSCCENRYMVTDDKLEDFSGSVFVEAELRDAPNEPGEYGEHEVQFLVIKTSKGEFTCATHNEHNGYYGGFGVVCRPVE